MPNCPTSPHVLLVPSSPNLLKYQLPDLKPALHSSSQFLTDYSTPANPDLRALIINSQKMHAKTDSEVTSIAPSSPPRSPTRRAAYYVQSPSRDSHDGEKTATDVSFHSTPVLSPSGSPPHSHSSVGRHSRESSSSRFSGSLKPRKGDAGSGRGRRRKVDVEKPWNKQCDAIEEEGLLDEDDESGGGIPRRCYFPLFVLAFVALFSFFALVLWGASRSQKPHIVMKSITFKNFNIQAGSDASGVPTDMASLNSTVKMTYRNTGTFFGVHVASTSVNLAYYQLTLASGYMNVFYQRRKSQRDVTVVVVGDRVPLYGSGSSLQMTPPPTGNNTSKASSIPPPQLGLSFTVRSTAYVLGKLVKPKFYTRIQCLVVMDQKKLNKPLSLAKSCQYD